MPTTSSITISGVPALIGGAVLLALAIAMLVAAKPTPDGQPAPFIRRWVTVYALISTALYALGLAAFLTGLGTAGAASTPLAIGIGLAGIAALAWRITRRRWRVTPVVSDSSLPPEPQRPKPTVITDKAA